MRNKSGFLILFMLLAATALSAQVAKPRKGTFALTNATIETITNGAQKGTLLIQNGKIAAMGASVTIPAGAETFDCSGLTIYPGMIDGGSSVGLSEVSSISLTNDYDEIGDITPQMEALTAVNPNGAAIPVTRVSGVTTTLVVPQNGLLPGTAALINLVGYTPDQMYAGAKVMAMNFPSAGRRGFFDQRSEEDIKKEVERNQKAMNEVFDQAALFARIDSAAQKDPSLKKDFNPEMQALAKVVRGELPLMIEVNSAEDIKAAIKWVAERKLKRVIFSGVAEGWRVAEEIAKAGIPVITGPVLALPTRASDPYDAPYANPGLMHKAGVKVALRTSSAENARRLPYNAGFAAAYGMGREAALRAVTIVPAQIFGVDKEMGSLEVGKDATLFVSTGDPFETKTLIKYLFIDGYLVPIDSRHIQLYNEFLNRATGVEK
ncbi:MAG: amidohydrolase family protein [Haliscomenobacter sp.]|nr:amidohydrolase family protein [Haliscomenobacter sp.]